MSHDLKEQASEILQVPTFELVRSPKCGAFEFESFSPSLGVKVTCLVWGAEKVYTPHQVNSGRGSYQVLKEKQSEAFCMDLFVCE